MKPLKYCVTRRDFSASVSLELRTLPLGKMWPPNGLQGWRLSGCYKSLASTKLLSGFSFLPPGKHQLLSTSLHQSGSGFLSIPVLRTTNALG